MEEERKKMKIVLAALNAKYVHSNLAVYDIEAYATKKLAAECTWEDETGHFKKADNARPELVVREYTINHNLDAILQSLYQEKAAVVAFSCYIWNIHEILTIARELHKVAPSTGIWLGGPEVSYDSEVMLEKYPFVEGIIQGEGEITFYELIQVWTGQGKYADVKGIVYRDRENGICRQEPREVMSLDEVPFIYQDLSKFQNKILYYETSRGCPFSCSYCLSSIDKRVRFRSLELVEEELRFFLDNDVAQVKFIDRTFNCKREHALAIWRYITEHDNGVTNFHFEISADLLGEEELALFRKMRPGLIQLEIGLQSTNPGTIKEIRRHMDIEKLKSNMRSIYDMHNIHQHLDLIAGLPYEDFVTFQQSFNDAYAMRPNQLQLGFLKVLKGSYMEERVEQYGLQYQDTQPYEVLSTKWISYDELLGLKKVEEMVEVYYNSDQFEHTLEYLLSFFERPFLFYQTLGDYYDRENLFGFGFKRETRYEVLRQFSIKWFGKSEEKNRILISKTDGSEFSTEVLEDLLTYDYYLRENAKSRPGWRKEQAIEKDAYNQFFKNGGTDEWRLFCEGYDSKAAARTMHLEQVNAISVKWLQKDGMENAPEPNGEVMYCLFDYTQRNPLSKDAEAHFLTHL